jgi:ferredoxin-NADP reductase
MSNTLPTFTLRVTEARQLNPLIRQFRLRAVDGSALPGYTAGAHLRVRVRLPGGSEDWRSPRVCDRGAPRGRWPRRLTLHA